MHPTFEDIIKIQNKSIHMQLIQWTQGELFSLQFWIMLALLLLPWVVWWKYNDRRRFLEILLYGALISTVVTIFDEIGSQLNLWEYKYDIEPILPRMIPINISVLPVIYMLAYQQFPRWKSFLSAHVLLAGALSFIAEPLMVKLNIYVMYSWKHIYSFPLYILLPVLLKLLMNSIIAGQEAARRK